MKEIRDNLLHLCSKTKTNGVQWSTSQREPYENKRNPRKARSHEAVHGDEKFGCLYHPQYRCSFKRVSSKVLGIPKMDQRLHRISRYGSSNQTTSRGLDRLPLFPSGSGRTKRHGVRPV